MENVQDIIKKIEDIVKVHPQYKTEAYTFVLAALNFTVSALDEPRHITGRELLEGIRTYGIQQFGPLTQTVFAHWGITRTDDFGSIVFTMVDHGLLGRTEQDSIDDFCDGYCFDDVFSANFDYVSD